MNNKSTHIQGPIPSLGVIVIEMVAPVRFRPAEGVPAGG